MINEKIKDELPHISGSIVETSNALSMSYPYIVSLRLDDGNPWNTSIRKRDNRNNKTYISRAVKLNQAGNGAENFVSNQLKNGQCGKQLHKKTIKSAIFKRNEFCLMDSYSKMETGNTAIVR